MSERPPDGGSVQKLPSFASCRIALRPNNRITSPIGVRITKYMTPMNMGVVIFESTWAKPIQARCTGPRLRGTSAPATSSAPAMPPKTRHDTG